MSHKKIQRNTGIQILDLVLLKSLFEYNTQVDAITLKPANLTLGVKYNLKEQENILQVNLVIEYTIENEKAESFLKIEVEKAALFGFDNDIEETLQENNIPSIEQFVSVNAASIIYSYIRQHIMDLSLKARIGPIILPVVNFVKLKEDS